MALHDPSIRVRREAVNGLVESCDTKAIPVLKNLLEDKDPVIQRLVRKPLTHP